MNNHAVGTAVQIITTACHEAAVNWWKNLDTGELTTSVYPEKKVNVPEKLMLIVTELSEAMEADRKNLMDEHLPHRHGLEVELADALIRIADLAGGLGLDLAGAVAEKLEYNAKRADHKIENRKAAGGKAY